jgi:4-hydroxy-tetrahydrodipicolinate synthase
MDRLTTALSGISGILVTPFDQEDRIAPKRLAPIVDRAVAAGVHILVANGNTGEFYSLSTDEAVAMVEAAAGLIAGRAPLLCGIGRALPDAVRLARVARAAGADGLMIHQPPDPFAAPRGVVDYVRRIADFAGDGLPLVLYLRNDAMGTDAIVDLCAVEGVVAVKWATPNPMRMAEAIAAADPRIVWVAGLAETWAPVLYSVGARGFTSGLINVWPERSMQIHAALEGGDYTRANGLIATMRAFEDIRAEELNGTNVTGVKAALVLQGLDCGRTRPPSAWPLTETQSRRLKAFMETSGLLRVPA